MEIIRNTIEQSVEFVELSIKMKIFSISDF